MLKRTRVSGTMDTGRLGEGLARPGMDTREWVSLAIVEDFAVEDDVLVDVLLLPSQQKATVRVGAVYSGDGFGIYAPLEVDDEVLVVFPEGVVDAGGVVVARLWSRADKAPDRAQTDQGDLLISVRSGRTLRIDVGGSGQVIIAGGSKGCARVDDAIVVDKSSLQASLDVRYALNAPSPGVPLLTSPTGTITAGSSKVKVG